MFSMWLLSIRGTRKVAHMPRIDTDGVVVAILTTNNIENGELDRILHLQIYKFISIHETVVVILPMPFLALSTCDAFTSCDTVLSF